MNRRFRRPLEEAELITLTFWPTYHTRGGLIRLQESRDPSASGTVCQIPTTPFQRAKLTP